MNRRKQATSEKLIRMSFAKLIFLGITYRKCMYLQITLRSFLPRQKLQNKKMSDINGKIKVEDILMQSCRSGNGFSGMGFQAVRMSLHNTCQTCTQWKTQRIANMIVQMPGSNIEAPIDIWRHGKSARKRQMANHIEIRDVCLCQYVSLYVCRSSENASADLGRMQLHHA